MNKGHAGKLESYAVRACSSQAWRVTQVIRLRYPSSASQALLCSAASPEVPEGNMAMRSVQYEPREESGMFLPRIMSYGRVQPRGAEGVSACWYCCTCILSEVVRETLGTPGRVGAKGSSVEDLHIRGLEGPREGEEI